MSFAATATHAACCDLKPAGLLPCAEHWYVVHTKPRQEQRAQFNLAQQGYACYLPLLATEKLCRGALTLVHEPLFSRYLFIRLDASHSGQSWGPIRSTLGVQGLVSFGNQPAKVNDDLIEALQCHSARQQERPLRLFQAGERVQVKDGPFAGLEAIYQMTQGEGRAQVLIELLSKPCRLSIAPASLRKLAGFALAAAPSSSGIKSASSPRQAYATSY